MNNLYNADLRLAGDSRPLHRHDGHCSRHNDGFSSIEEMQSALIRQTAIFGEDDRKKVNIGDDRIYSVGSVTCYKVSGASSTGSAAVVRAKGEEEGDVILTAEHNFRDTETGVEKVKCLFRPGHDQHVKIPIDMGKIVYGGMFETQNDGDDWAVAGLEDTLMFDYVDYGGEKTETKKKDLLKPLYSPFPLIGHPNSGMTLDEPLAGRPIELYGYNRDTQRMSVSDRCSIQPKKPGDYHYRNDKLRLHNCDCVGGCSGGVLTTLNSQRQRVIVGIHVMEFSEDNLDPSDRNNFDSQRNGNAAIVINERILQAIESF